MMMVQYLAINKYNIDTYWIPEIYTESFLSESLR